MNNRILVTGAAGYIGSVLVKQLLDRNYHVTGLDNLMFGGESLIPHMSNKRFNFIKGDIRDDKLISEVLNEVTSVIHLAAIVGDPACSKFADLAKETNWDGAKTIFDLATDKKHIQNFVFASTCSNYGKMEGNDFLNEESPLKPVSLYAELKVQFEKYLFSSKRRDGFFPTALRFATVYGLSPRIRFDLTVNEFIREVAFDRELVIFGEQFWRPYTHVEDLARSCHLVIESDPKKVSYNVYGVGDTNENYQKKMIAEEILKIIPSANIKYISKTEDPRDYRVDFSKIKKELGFTITKKVPDGLKEIHKILKDGLLPDPFSEKYQNI
ncbi:MAG: NAD(P)-dependent oxidoreductase [Bacteroidia bacterium]|nr:NAD(P)-dependent oxidoreductase [Bacteroidia bacterium]